MEADSKADSIKTGGLRYEYMRRIARQRIYIPHVFSMSDPMSSCFFWLSS